ncbi:hypothetical protein F5Y16DRAFT_381203 [Xylariaceae sp. FL0255]|nr:hypothetical protein F5Y16DRAFT_381203 [Xylariaceae sp. FL0255]
MSSITSTPAITSTLESKTTAISTTTSITSQPSQDTVSSSMTSFPLTTVSQTSIISQEGINTSSSSRSTPNESDLVGIGIGAAFGAIGIAALLAAAIIMRRTRREHERGNRRHTPLIHPQQSGQAYEMSSETRKPELEGGHFRRTELPVSMVGSPAELYG